MDDIIARMNAEEADLVRKLDAVRAFKAAYGFAAISTNGASPRPATNVAPVRAARPYVPRTADERKDKFGSYGVAVIDAALAAVMPGDATPTPTREIVSRVESLGLTIRGKNKVNALAALLARSSKFKGHGRSGWTASAEEIAPSGAEENGHPGTLSPGVPDACPDGDPGDPNNVQPNP